MAIVQTRRELLQSLSLTAFGLSNSTSYPPSPSRTSTHIVVEPLLLTPALGKFESDISRSLVTPQAKQAALRSATELVSSYQQLFVKYTKRLQALPEITGGLSTAESIDGLRRTYQQQFEQRDLPKLLTTALKSKAPEARQEGPSRASPTPRRIFNHAFTPYLDAYFEQNAFPSHADQQVLATKSGMTVSQIVNWFQNHRSRARAKAKGCEADLKRLSAGQSINEELLQAKIQLVTASRSDTTHDHTSMDDEDDEPETPSHIDLDGLASSSTDTIPNTYESISIEPCIAESDAFGLPTPSKARASMPSQPTVDIDAIDTMFNGFNIRVSSPSQSTSIPAKPTTSGARASTPKATARKNPFKAALRSCFSTAITLTCPRSHPALIKRKRNQRFFSTDKTTVLEQKRVPVQPYTLPAVLPTWEIPTTPEEQPSSVRRKKPTLASHAGKTRPGSPYPKQTLSRVSSSSSLASMASNDSQSSSRSVSSTSSASTLESLELETPTQSPSINPVELVDDPRFPDDLFGDYLFNPDPFPMDFSTFDLNVEEPFEKDVSLSFAEFDQPISLSIPDFDSTSVPSFDFFES